MKTFLWVFIILLLAFAAFQVWQIWDLQQRLNELEYNTNKILHQESILENYIRQQDGRSTDQAEAISWATVLSAKRYGLPWELVAAIEQNESEFFTGAISRARCRGLMQLSPDKARQLRDWRDPYQNIPAGVRYFRQMLDRFGSVKTALYAYNSGPERRRKEVISRGYADKVLWAMQRLEGL